MAGYGEVYAEVEAGVVNSGINTLAGSGEIGEAGNAGTVVVWLLWNYDNINAGFTGKNWYWDDPLNPLKTNWTSTHTGDTVEDFNNWLRTTNPTDLNEYLGNWPAKDKATFCENHSSVLGIGQGNCIEYRGY